MRVPFTGEKRQTIVAGAHLPELVLPHLLECCFIGDRIILDGDLRDHASHRMNPAVARLEQQEDVRIQEVPVHGDRGSIRQDKIGAVAEFLGEAEDLVPAPAIEAGGVLAQLVQDLGFDFVAAAA